MGMRSHSLENRDKVKEEEEEEEERRGEKRRRERGEYIDGKLGADVGRKVIYELGESQVL